MKNLPQAKPKDRPKEQTIAEQYTGKEIYQLSSVTRIKVYSPDKIQLFFLGRDSHTCTDRGVIKKILTGFVNGNDLSLTCLI